ncbi:MAG: DUF1961 family protein [Planctomycetaceae bacterium]
MQQSLMPLLFVLPFLSAAGADEAQPARKTEALFSDDFSAGMDRWWVEGGQSVRVEDGRLHVAADPPAGEKGHVATVWCKQPIDGDVRITCAAHVVSSSVEANNINFFLFYSDPSGKPLEETAPQRADADYRDYHELHGYIVTYLNGGREDADSDNPRARIRIRRCPGFELLEETFAHHCEAGRTYRFEIVRQGKRLTVRVDGKKLLEAEDLEPHRSGHFGLRTFRTRLWWDDIRVERIEPACR